MGGHLGIFSIADARRLAQKRLPRMIFNYVDGAASDEKAAQLNIDRLSDLRLMPRVLRNVLPIFLLKRPISPWGSSAKLG